MKVFFDYLGSWLSAFRFATCLVPSIENSPPNCITPIWFEPEFVQGIWQDVHGSVLGAGIRCASYVIDLEIYERWDSESFQCTVYLFLMVAVPVVLSKSSLIFGKVVKWEDIVLCSRHTPQPRKFSSLYTYTLYPILSTNRAQEHKVKWIAFSLLFSYSYIWFWFWFYAVFPYRMMEIRFDFRLVVLW